MLSKPVSIAAGSLLAAFVGYCIYFDRKRRSHPDFKKRLIEKRRRQREENANRSAGGPPIPDLKDPEAMQQFFMQEIQLGELLLSQGDIETGVEHLSNAVTVCAQPSHLLQVLQQTLPNPIFSLLMESLPRAQKRFAAARKDVIRSMGEGGDSVNKAKTLEITEDDVE